MGKLFKNYEECELVIITMCKELSDNSLNKIALAINVSKSLADDKDKIFRLTQSYISSLWDIDEAIAAGFHRWYKLMVIETKDLLAYHKKHCPKNNKCIVCNNIKQIKIRMRNIHERKRPKVHIK